MAAQGGCPRLGKFIGPYPGGLMGHASLRLPFFAQALCSLAAVVPLYVVSRRRASLEADPAPRKEAGAPAPPESPARRSGFFESSAFDSPTVLAALVFAFCLQLLRFAIPIIVPLIGLENGMSVGSIGLSLTVAGALEFACFPIAGASGRRPPPCPLHRAPNGPLTGPPHSSAQACSSTGTAGGPRRPSCSPS